MAELRLNENVTVEDIKILLDVNLNHSITPHVGELPHINSKGIYFWFMKSNIGYESLSRYVSISPIQGCYFKTINGVKYDLIYIGTAGTKGQGLSTISDRLDWHIYQHHTKGEICNGTLSTFRKGLGSFLSNDLIIGDSLSTEEKVNVFMNVTLEVYWIEYGNNVPIINSDEKFLINNLKPLFNLDHNPNSYIDAQANPTKIYQLRRNQIEASSIAKHCKEGGSGSKVNTKRKSDVPPKTPLNNAEIEQSSSSNPNKKCVSFIVKQNESVADVAARTTGLPNGPISIEIKDVITGQNLFVRNNGNPLRTTGRTVSAYFRAPMTNDIPVLPKWEVLQNEMTAKKVKEVRVIVCPNN